MAQVFLSQPLEKPTKLNLSKRQTVHASLQCIGSYQSKVTSFSNTSMDVH